MRQFLMLNVKIAQNICGWGNMFQFLSLEHLYKVIAQTLSFIF